MAMLDSLQNLIHEVAGIAKNCLLHPDNRVVDNFAVDGLKYQINELLIDEVLMQLYYIGMI